VAIVENYYHRRNPHITGGWVKQISWRDREPPVTEPEVFEDHLLNEVIEAERQGGRCRP